MRAHWSLAYLLTLAAFPADGIAQQLSTDVRPNLAARLATAVRTDPAPALDGRLDDPVWRTATALTGFVQRDPHEGEPGTERTEAWVAYTPHALYVAVRAWDSDPSGITAQLTRRDEHSPSDWVAIAVDSYNDRRTAFVFWVNPAGVKRDVYLFNDVEEDDSWDAVWDVAVRRDEQGWVAEFEIPFSQLRFPGAEEHRFGFQVVRTINRKNEEQHWRLMPKNEPGLVSRFGELSGLQGIKPPRRIEVMPYVVARQDWSPEQEGNPFATGRDRNARFGGDLNVGITSNLTLNATINPDFGQVEADPAVVNLSAFETFFSERRPFFSEGLDAFRFNLGVGDGDNSMNTLFYTRRIGRSPQGSADARGGYAESITNTTILGAAKLSGKTPSGWTIGLLGAATAEETADVLDSTGATFADVVEPQSNYFVGRLARDFRGGLTQAGFFGTAVQRNLPDEGNLDFLHDEAYTGGLNWRHRFANDGYSLSGWIAGSHVTGSPEAIDRTQRSSARYFQRPDNDYVTYNPTRTSLTGMGALIGLEKTSGNWRFMVGGDTKSPGLEVNDLGFQAQVDETSQWLWVQRRWMEPGRIFRRVFINLNEWAGWNYGWDRTYTGGNVNMHFTLLNYWGWGFGINRNVGGLGTRALRGGPAMQQPGNWNGWFNAFTDSRKALRFDMGGFWFTQPEAEDTRGWGIWGTVAFRPAGNVDLSFSPEWNVNNDDWQYLDAPVALDETQYLFGELEQRTAVASLRANVTLTPRLSVQLWGQPFVSTGRYVEYMRVTDPRADRYQDRWDVFGDDRAQTNADGEVFIDLDADGTTDVNLGNPDFRFLSFRSNAVLRWEFRPGSSLFVVWQHGRSDFGTNGRFELGSGVKELFRSPANNTFLVKASYWFSL
jgi:Domain of unknown function (DUF5916)